MAIDPALATQRAEQLNLLGAGAVGSGITEAPIGPVVQDPAMQPISPEMQPISPEMRPVSPEMQPVQVAGMGQSIGKLIGRLIGGEDLEAARRLQRDQPDVPEEIASPEDQIDPVAPAVKPAINLSEEALAARIQEQSDRIRPTEVETNELLQATLEPQRTELVSEGMTDFTAVGARGDAKIPDEGSVLAIIEKTSQTYRMEVDEATRGVVTHEVSQELADYIGMDPQKVLRAVMNMRDTGGVPIIEGAGLSETLLAVRNLLYTEVSKLDAMVDSVIDEAGNVKGGAEELLNFRQQFEVVSNLQSQFKGAQTEVARSLGIFRVPMDQGAGAMRDINLANLMHEFGGQDNLSDLAKAYKALPTGKQRAQAAQKLSKFKKFTNAAFEVWMNLLLSGPITHTKNFVSAGMATFGEIPVNLVAATMGSVRRAAGGEGGVTFGEVRAQAFGQLMAIREAFMAAGKSYRTGQVPIAGTKLMDTAGPRQGRAPAFSSEAFEYGGIFAPAVDAIGSFLTLGRIPTKALQFEDTFWKVVAQRGSLYQQAYRAAREQNLSNDDAAGFIAEFVSNPPATAVKEADDLARLVTLQQPLESKLGKSVQGMARVGFMRWFVPFVTTPYNAFSFAFEHSPLASFTKNFQDAMTSGDPARIDRARARRALGSTAAATVGFMAANGLVTGGGPKDPGLRAGYMDQGWRPYSIKVGNEYYSYAGGEPYSTIIGITADMVEVAQLGLADQDEIDQIASAVVFAFSKNMTNKTFMEGFSRVVDAMSDPGRYSENVISGFTRSAVPAVVRQGGQLFMDERVRSLENVPLPQELSDLNIEQQQRFNSVLERYEEWAWIKDRLDQIKDQIPGWGNAPAMRDFWGRKVANQGALGPDIISPIYRSTHEPNVLDEEMLRLKIRETHHPREYLGFPFSAEEYEFFQERAGMYAAEFMTRLFNSAGYQRLRETGLPQRFDAEVNQRAKAEMQKQIRNARQRALRDLLYDEDLGQNLRESMRQHERMRGELERESFYPGETR